MNPAEIVALHGHLEACPDCRKALEEASLAGISPAGGLFPPGGFAAHLTEEEMVALVAGRMTEARRGAAARHVETCEECADSVVAMQSVRLQAARAPARPSTIRWYAMGAIAAGLLAAAVAQYWRVHPGAGPRPAVVASLRDGGRTIELDANGTVRGLEGAAPEDLALVRDVLQRRALPAGQGLPAATPGVLLGPDTGAPAFSPISPIDAKVLPDRPLFAWSALPGATAYQVVVTNEKLDPLVRSGRIRSTEWRPETPLPRGATLFWQVRAWRGGEMLSAPAPPAPPAKFEIAEDQVAVRLEGIRSSPQPSHLLAAALCAREGLKDEAAAELQALARENPGSPLVRSLESR